MNRYADSLGTTLDLIQIHFLPRDAPRTVFVLFLCNSVMWSALLTAKDHLNSSRLTKKSCFEPYDIDFG